MNPHRVPPCYSEGVFRKFEQDIATAVNIFPAVHICDAAHSHYTWITYVARLRDSLCSYKKYQWPSELIRKADFEIVLKLKVAERDGIVLIGCHEALREYDKKPTPAYELPCMPLVITSRDHLRQICMMVVNKNLPPLYPVKGITKDDVAWVNDDDFIDVTITKFTDNQNEHTSNEQTIYVIH